MELSKREMTKLALEALRGGYIEKAYGLIEESLNEPVLDEGSHECSTCHCVYTDDEGGIEGYFGILYMAFCPTCFSSICDMADQFNQREWVSLTEEQVNDIYQKTQEKVNEHWNEGGTTMMFPITLYKEIEAKLKESNDESIS